MDINKNSINTGNNSKSAIGDGNVFIDTVINAAPPLGVPRSYIYDVCCQIIEADIKPSEDYSIEFNAEWTEKLSFNKVSEYYAEIFSNDAYAYDEVSEIMSNFNNREILVRKIHNIYLDEEKTRETANEDGDFVLKAVFQKLQAFLTDHESKLLERMPAEELDRCIWLLMFYTFTKCQLLKKPMIGAIG